MLIGVPRLYGMWHMVLTGLLQHIGLADNVVDHRLNSRTVYMNPISRFIYWNMNYHVEHHMYPMVPYHALPKLHELIKHDLPEPNPSMWHAYREVWPVLLKQLKYEDYLPQRELPPTARPYREEFHDGCRSGGGIPPARKLTPAAVLRRFLRFRCHVPKPLRSGSESVTIRSQERVSMTDGSHRADCIDRNWRWHGGLG